MEEHHTQSIKIEVKEEQNDYIWTTREEMHLNEGLQQERTATPFSKNLTAARELKCKQFGYEASRKGQLIQDEKRVHQNNIEYFFTKCKIQIISTVKCLKLLKALVDSKPRQQ